jgi:HEAT repeat protein
LCKLDPATLASHATDFTDRLASADGKECVSGLRALAKLTPILQQSAPLIFRRLEDDDVNVRCAVLETMRVMKPAIILSKMSSVVPMLVDPNDNVRSMVIDLINLIDPTEFVAQTASLTPQIISCIRFPDDRVRALAVTLAGHYLDYDQELVRQYVELGDFVQLLQDPSTQVRLATIPTAARFEKQDFIAYAEGIVDTFAKEAERERGATSARNTPRAASVSKLLMKTLFCKLDPTVLEAKQEVLLPEIAAAFKRLENQKWQVRREAAEVIGALAHLTTENEMYSLYEKLEDPRLEVSCAVGDALSRIAHFKLKDLAEEFVQKLRGAHEGARMSSVKILQQLATTTESSTPLLNKQQIQALQRVGAS